MLFGVYFCIKRVRNDASGVLLLEEEFVWESR